MIIIVSTANKTLALINIFVDRCECETKRIALQILTIRLYEDKEFSSKLLQITFIIIFDYLSRYDRPALISIKPQIHFRIGARKNGNDFLNKITRRTVVIRAQRLIDSRNVVFSLCHEITSDLLKNRLSPAKFLQRCLDHMPDDVIP